MPRKLQCRLGRGPLGLGPGAGGSHLYEGLLEMDSSGRVLPTEGLDPALASHMFWVHGVTEAQNTGLACSQCTLYSHARGAHCPQPGVLAVRSALQPWTSSRLPAAS